MNEEFTFKPDFGIEETQTEAELYDSGNNEMEPIISQRRQCGACFRFFGVESFYGSNPICIDCISKRGANVIRQKFITLNPYQGK